MISINIFFDLDKETVSSQEKNFSSEENIFPSEENLISSEESSNKPSLFRLLLQSIV